MTRERCCLSTMWRLVLVFGGFRFVGALDFEDPMPSMVADNGYPLEVHSATTTDGYILGMHRIPFGVKSPAAPNKPVALLMHPTHSTSYCFTYLGKDHSLAFILADAGYDVWLGNTRGNVYARSNIYISPKSPAFWDFSWHERGAFDLPAMIDYVLEETKQEKLSYISHSRGGTMFFVLMSTLPEYNEKIKVAINMAPYVFMLTPRGILQDLVAGGSRLGEWISVFLGMHEFRVTPALAEMFDLHRCKEIPIMQTFCEEMTFISTGYSSARMNKTKLADIAKGSRLGASVKEMAHYGQLITFKRFSKYDYGFIGNVARYGSLLPPSYDLAKVTAPVVIINGVDDIGATTQEIAMLLKALPSQANHVLIEEKGFTHIDFIASDDAKTLVYGKILDELEKHSK